MQFEVCVDSAEGAAAAQEGGAQRVELCADLVEGGVTPSLGLIRLARRSISIGLQVLIRPRAGDFVYSDLEVEVMSADIEAARAAGADGVVLGLLLPDGRVDLRRTEALVALAHPMNVTFHRALDMSRDSSEALEDLISLGIERVLTSGRKPSALQGADCIAKLVRQSTGRAVIMAGGGISAETLPALSAATGVSEVHFSARAARPSPMTFRNLECWMGKAYQPDEYIHKVTAPDLVRAVIKSIS
jgi:copper homeostasis protein